MTSDKGIYAIVEVTVKVPVMVFDPNEAPGVAEFKVREALRYSDLRDVEASAMCWKVEA